MIIGMVQAFKVSSTSRDDDSSSALVLSSNSKTSGSNDIAIANAAFCDSPPDRVDHGWSKASTLMFQFLAISLGTVRVYRSS